MSAEGNTGGGGGGWRVIQLKCQLFLCCDILFTPARLDCGNEELVMKLKCQLKETHQELEETRIELDKKSQASIGFQEEVYN